MSAITNVWRQLVQRRLWPVAILLIAALAAVPLALAKEPKPASPRPTAPTGQTGESALAMKPIVAQATAADRAKPRKVLGTAKNPFGLPKTDEPGSAAAVNSDGAVVAKAPDSKREEPSAATPPGSSTSPPSGGVPTPPSVPAEPAPAPRSYDMYDLTVRFGDASGSAGRKTLARLQPLPSADEPVLIYLGVLKDGKTAVFLVDHGVSAIGDGDCRPSEQECETIRLKAGDTEFFDVTDETGNVTAQYQLDLIKIHKGSTTSATQAKASSNAGQRLLKARAGSEGPSAYRWDAATGTLEKRPGRSVGTAVGRTAALRP